MKRIFALAFLIVICSSASAQVKAAGDDLGNFATQIKTGLTEKLQLNSAIADNVAAIEVNYLKAITELDGQKGLSIKEKQNRLYNLEVKRRESLAAASLSGRSMEDVIELSKRLRPKVSASKASN